MFALSYLSASGIQLSLLYLIPIQSTNSFSSNIIRRQQFPFAKGQQRVWKSNLIFLVKD